ncbi:MAG: PglZ domain-containing protein [Planctomycetota bacterium]
MHAFHEYISEQLVEKLRKRRVVVWYDPRSEFGPFIRELCGGSDPLACMLQPVQVGELPAHVGVGFGSFFEVKFTVEPLMAADVPEPLLIYIPAERPDRTESPLMELEKAGECYEPQLKRLARNVLRHQYSDGQIDEMLAAETVAYEDVVGLLKEDDGRQKSMLKVIFADARDNATVVADWIAMPAVDAKIAEKSAKGELFKLIESRLGLQLGGELNLAEARTKAMRYVLVGEFRDDFEGEPPTAAAMIPAPPTKDQTKFVREVAQSLRLRHGDEYVGLADQVESEFGLADAALQPEKLGRIDTFRFEERTLLSYAGQLLVNRRCEQASKVVSDHRRSFWTDRDLRRQNQWEACRLMAEQGSLAAEVRKSLPKAAEPKAWIERYTAADGWYRLDFVQRNLEALVASMTEDPESEEALSAVRTEYEHVLREMTRGFVQALQTARWSLSGVLGQSSIYPELVQANGGKVAYILVDSLRYEMGIELRNQLSDADELGLRAAIAAIPTITPVGMAALMPGASASFNVTESGGSLTPEVDGTALTGLPGRQKFLKGRVPQVVDFELGKLLDMKAREVEKKVASATLVVVRSQDIDSLGEGGSNRIARQVMDTAVGNVARAVRKLADAGIERFIVAADHGHLFTSAKDESMRIDSPGGQTVELHRRCWIGRGGMTPQATVRVSGPELGYKTDLDFVFPLGIGVFKAGGDLAYHHGGLSLQELLIPVLTVRMVRRGKPAVGGVTITLSDVPSELRNRTMGITITAPADLFGGEPVLVRPVLLHGGVQVGEAGMALDAEFDPRTRCVKLQPGKTARIAMLLQNESCDKLRVVVQDPTTDAVLAQSAEVQVKLGI